MKTGLFVTLLLFALTAVAGPFDSLEREDNAKHTPVITAPNLVTAGEPFEVTITMGRKPHPTGSDHFIRFIALYAGEVEIARALLTPTLAVPKVTFTVQLEKSTTLEARAAPNHSAAWTATHRVTVNEKTESDNSGEAAEESKTEEAAEGKSEEVAEGETEEPASE